MIRAAALFTMTTLAVSVPMAQTPAAQAKPDALQTRPERTNFEETSRLEDITAFLTALSAKSPLVRVQTFGTTEEGRPMPLVTLSNPAVSKPADRPAGRPVVFLLANIHGGEVEGKEAVQVLMRRLTSGDLRPLLDRMVIVIAPIYNIDGNEAVDVMNRTAQYGPVAGVGRRENVKGLDLNRDYMKLESAEARALAAAFTAWDPHLDRRPAHDQRVVPRLSPHAVDPAQPVAQRQDLDYHRETMMPAIMKSLEAKHKVRAYYYGNFGRGNAAAGELRRWNSFDHRPRAGQNYVGFRNRLTILSEAYSYLSFKRRIEVTEQFVEEILKYVDGHRAEIVALTKSLDDEWIEARARVGRDAPRRRVRAAPASQAGADPRRRGEAGGQSAQSAADDGGDRGQLQAGADAGLRLLRADAHGARWRAPTSCRPTRPFSRSSTRSASTASSSRSSRRRSPTEVSSFVVEDDHQVAQALPGPQRGEAEGSGTSRKR